MICDKKAPKNLEELRIEDCKIPKEALAILLGFVKTQS